MQKIYSTNIPQPRLTAILCHQAMEIYLDLTYLVYVGFYELIHFPYKYLSHLAANVVCWVRIRLPIVCS